MINSLQIIIFSLLALHDQQASTMSQLSSSATKNVRNVAAKKRFIINASGETSADLATEKYVDSTAQDLHNQLRHVNFKDAVSPPISPRSLKNQNAGSGRKLIDKLNNRVSEGIRKENYNLSQLSRFNNTAIIETPDPRFGNSKRLYHLYDPTKAEAKASLPSADMIEVLLLRNFLFTTKLIAILGDTERFSAERGAHLHVGARDTANSKDLRLVFPIASYFNLQEYQPEG